MDKYRHTGSLTTDLLSFSECFCVGSLQARSPVESLELGQPGDHQFSVCISDRSVQRSPPFQKALSIC